MLYKMKLEEGVMAAKDITVSIEQALNIILDLVEPLGCGTVFVLDACDRVLSEDIIADTMVPPADDSAMDGYAVIAEDTCFASSGNPVPLHITGEVQAGGSPEGLKVVRGTAVRIMTGAPLPDGADAVIPVEDTTETCGLVNILRPVVPWENCRSAGESITAGDIVLAKGERLKSADIGILASLNRSTVSVYRQPTVAIISTGNELVDPGEEIAAGQIRNVNAYTLYAEAKKYSAIPRYLGIVRDDVDATRQMFREALEADIVISTGGVSMGKYDLIKDVYTDLGIETHFGWIKVKPGRPCTFGTKGNKLIFGLPGNPVSTMTSFIQFVRPALLSLMGARKIYKPVVNAILEEDLRKQKGKAHLLRGHFTIRNNEFYVSTTGNQKSSVLLSMCAANCLIMLPEHFTEAHAGDQVAIQLVDHNEVEGSSHSGPPITLKSINMS